jgi:hypothetical protein
MLRINKTPTFTVAVPLLVEGIDDPQAFRATFRAISDEEALAADTRSVDGFKAFLRKIVVELHDLVDDNDQPVACTPPLMEELLCHSHIRTALQGAYWRALLKARAGN